MRLARLLVVVGVLAACSATSPVVSPPVQEPDELTSAVAPLTRPPFGTATSLAIVHGSQRAARALGSIHDGGPSAGADTRFNVASVSKVLTAARVVGLAHAGALDLDDPVSKYLPGVRLIDRDGTDRAGAVTVRQLVQHRAGVPHQPKDLEAKVNGAWGAPDLLTRLTDDWSIALDASSGTFHYANTGYALLGALIERVERCSFADCMQAWLRELGMTQSTYWPATLPADAAHGKTTSAGEPTFHPPSWYGSRYALPFTGLWSSMPDLARFGELLLRAARDGRAPLHAMARNSDALGLFHGTRLGAVSLEHDGSGPGFHAALVVVPDAGLVVALATNGGSETKAEAFAFSDAVEKAVAAAAR